MAEIDHIIQAVQARAQNIGVPYAAHIKSAVLSAWAYVADQAEWWFLRSGTPITVTIAADADLFTVEFSNRIGRPLHIANEYDRRMMTFKRRADWQRLRAKLSDDSTTVSSLVFTDAGIVTVDGTPRRQFRVFPKSADTQTLYLHYQEAGTEDNLAYAPAHFELLLVHGALSLVAPPEKIGGEKVSPERWAAIAYHEEQLFQKYLQDVTHNHGATQDLEPEIILDSDVEAAIDEINDL